MIFGLPGSGKTTFASFLSKELGLPLYHLDRYFFEANWKERNYEEFLSIQERFVQTERWIIDGNATKSLDMRWKRADLVIYFRFNRFLCLWRLIKRVFFSSDFEDTPDGCFKGIRWKLISYMWTFHKKRGLPAIETFKEIYPKASFRIVSSSKDKKMLERELKNLLNTGSSKGFI